MEGPASRPAELDAAPSEPWDIVLRPLGPDRLARLRRRVALLLGGMVLLLAAFHASGRLAARPDRMVAAWPAWKAFAGTIRAERRFRGLAEGCRRIAADPAGTRPGRDAPWNPYAGYLGAAWHVQRWGRRAGLDPVGMPPGAEEVLALSEVIDRVLSRESRGDAAVLLEDMACLQEDAADWSVSVRVRLQRVHPCLEDPDVDGR